MKASNFISSIQSNIVTGASALDSIKGLLTWFFGAGSIGLIIVGVIQLAESFTESNGAQRKNGIMIILGGLLLGGAAGLVQILTDPPGY